MNTFTHLSSKWQVLPTLLLRVLLYPFMCFSLTYVLCVDWWGLIETTWEDGCLVTIVMHRPLDCFVRIKYKCSTYVFPISKLSRLTTESNHDYANAIGVYHQIAFQLEGSPRKYINDHSSESRRVITSGHMFSSMKAEIYPYFPNLVHELIGYDQ